MTVSVTLVRTLVEEIARVGADPDAFLADAGVDPRILDDANARIECVQYDRLHEAALDVTADPALGLHMAERAKLGAFHVVGYLAVHGGSLRQALGVFTRYRRLLSDCGAPALDEVDDEAILTCYFVRGPERCNRLRAEFNVTSLVKTAHMSLGVASPPRAVEFEHEAPSYADEYTRVLGCEVRFGADGTRIRFPREVLDAPHIHQNTELFNLLASQADRHMESLALSPDGPSSGALGAPVSGRVRAIVLEQFDTKPTMETVARRMGVSARSLRRRLQEEGHGFAELVESAMAEVARRLLGDPATSIQDVADRLGFSEPSAFHRAFKRWTGLTPRQFREHRAHA
jgi:AraC-like DNA-binding protein